MVAVTAGGHALGKGDLRLRERELAATLDAYAKLPKEERAPTLEDPAKAQPPKRAVPEPPANGLVLRGYCTYLRRDAKGQLARAGQYYYVENPDRWMAETQSDLLWLTEAERKSLIPEKPKFGDRHEVTSAIQKRFYSTIGIDYMEGSVNSLAPRKTNMTLTVREVTEQAISLRLDGYAHLGKELDPNQRSKPNSRGCELRILGEVRYDRAKQAITKFDVVGIGLGWGNKMDYVQREVRLDEYPWTYGIACELVTGDAPQDRIPPYNLLHYNSTGPYFSEEGR